MTTPTNPLTEAKAKSLDEIFSSNPMGYSDKEAEIVIAEFREQRARWTVAEAAGKKSAPKMPKTAAPTNLSLGDLGL